MSGTKSFTVLSISLLLLLASCSTNPQPIKVGKDTCSFCKMGVTDQRFGAEVITKKGKIYKFDDLHCFIKFRNGNIGKREEIENIYVVDFEAPHGFVELQKAALLKSETFRSPMGSNVAAFKNEQALKANTKVFKGKAVQLNDLMSDK